MKRTRLGVTAAVLGSALLGSAPATEWREAYARPAGARCDLAAGYATAALLAPARRARLAADETMAATRAAGANPFGAARHGNLGLGSVMQSLDEMNGPRTAVPRQNPYER